MKTAIVIQAGGSGTRLWPLSTVDNPKQFVKLMDGKSLLRSTFDRIKTQYNIENIFVTTNIKFKDSVTSDIPELPEKNILFESKKMDTGPAIGLMSFRIKELGYDTVISIACDHNIEDVDKFLKTLKIADGISEKYRNHLILIGMNPNYAATGFGYIEMGEPTDRYEGEIIFNVNSFKEKPDKKTAEKFVEDWRYLWNASYFIFNPSFIIEKYKEFSQATYDALEKCFNLDVRSEEFISEYSKCESISFDYLIVERLKEVLVIPANVGWSDIGSWKDTRDILSTDEVNNNLLVGNVNSTDTTGTVTYSLNPKKLITILGLDDIVVIDTEKALLVTTIERSQDVKKILENIPEEYK